MNTIVEHINSAGRIFVEFALPMLIQSSVLIAILLLVDLLLRKKVKAVFRYWIWMLVLVKLVLPTSLSSPLSLGYFFGDKLTYQDLAQSSPTLEPTVPAQADISPGIDPLFIQPNPYIPPTEPAISFVEPAIAGPVSPPQVPVTPLSWQGVVFLVWLAVVIAMGLLLLQRAFFVRGLVAQSKEAGCLMNDALAYCCASMGIKSKVGLKISVNATTPSVCGLIRPVILVPWNLTSTLGASRMRTVLMHELAHIRRGDLWVNLAQTVLQIIYFYNPLLWLANCVIRRVREQAVDEAVLVAMGEKAQKYPQTLVDVAKMAFKRPALSLRLIGVVESKSALAGRIKHILGRPMPKTAKLGIIGLLAVIIAGAILLPMAKAKKATFAGEGGPDVQVEVGSAAKRRKVYLPDLYVSKKILDLASGKLIAYPLFGEPLEKVHKAIREKGKGDLFYARNALAFLRGSQPDQYETIKENGVLCKIYRIGESFPQTITVTTKEGRKYKVKIVSADEKGCQLEYEPIEKPDVQVEAEEKILKRFFNQIDREIGELKTKYPQLADWNAEKTDAKGFSTGKEISENRLIYNHAVFPGRSPGSKDWCGENGCHIQIARYTSLEGPYMKTRIFPLKKGTMFSVIARVITGNPEVPELEQKINDIFQSAATSAAPEPDVQGEGGDDRERGSQFAATLPNGVRVEQPATIRVPEDYPTEYAAVKAAKAGDTIVVSGERARGEDILIEPELEFLAWHKTDRDNYWHADGSIVSDKNDLRILKNISHPGCGDPQHPNYEWLKLSFSHPSFDEKSYIELRMINDTGEHRKFVSVTATGAENPEPRNGNRGWVLYTVSLGTKEDFPRQCNFELDYAIGQWKTEIKELPKDDNGIMTFGSGFLLGSIGQNAEGKTTIDYTHKKTETSHHQHRFVAVTQNGIVPPSGHAQGGYPDLYKDEYKFDIPLEEIQHFQFQTRKVKTATFKNVSLRPGVKTDVQIKTENNIQAPPLRDLERKLIEQVLDLVKQVEKKYPEQATHWPAGPGLYHVDAQGHVTVWHYQLLWRRSTDCAEDEVGWGSSQLASAKGMYYLPDGTPLQSRWSERGGGMKDIRVKVGRTVGKDERVPVIHRHRLPGDHDLLSRDGRKRKIEFTSWEKLPVAIIVRIDKPVRLDSWWLGEAARIHHYEDYDQLFAMAPPVDYQPMYVFFICPEDEDHMLDDTAKTSLQPGLKTDVQIEVESEKISGVVGVQDSTLGKNTSAEAAFIIQKVLDRYAAIKTYSAIGELLTDVDRPLETMGVMPGMTTEMLQQMGEQQLKSIFTIKMARPNLYCIEWSENIDTDLSKVGNAWSVGDGSYGLILGKEKSFDEPLRALIWTASNMGRVQSSLFFDTSLNTLRELRDLSQQEDEQPEGVDCYVISGSRHRTTYTYWVSKKDFLIRRYKFVSGGDGKPIEGGGHELTDETIKVSLKAMDKEATPEEIAKIRAMLTAANAMASGVKVTNTETYRNIILDQPISKEQFVPSKDIDEITEELKDLQAKYIHRLKNISPTDPNLKTDVQVEGEKTISPRLVMLLGAINSCTAETELNIDSISIKAGKINIKGDTSSRTNTLKFLDAIKKNELEVLQLSFVARDNRDKFSLVVKLKKNWQKWWQQHKTDVHVGVENTISPKLVMLLGAINSCAAETDLNVDSISIATRNIEIKGDTAGRTDTQKFLDTIKKNGLKILRLSLDTRGNRDRFSIDVEPKENWRQWWQRHKADVQVEVDDADPGFKALHITSHNDGLRIEFSDAQSIVLENGKVSTVSSNGDNKFQVQATRLQMKLNPVTIDLDGQKNRVYVSGLGCSAEITPQNGLIEVRWTDGNQTNIQKGGSLKILLPDFQITVYDKAGRRQSLLKPRQRKGLISGEAVQTDVLVGTGKAVGGEWEDVGNPIPADFNDTMVLTEQITLRSIGQDAEGKTFITFVWDKEKNRNRQYRFVLIKNNDTILEPDSHLILVENKRLEEKFTFDEPYVSWRLKEFKLQSRPPPLAGNRSISSKLQKGTSTAFEGKTISPSRLAPPGRYAIELDGVDDYLLVPDSPTLRLDPPFTVEMWIKPRLPEQKVDRLQQWGVIAQGGYIGTGRVKTRGFGIELIRFEKEPAKFNISYNEASDSGIAGSDYGSYSFDEWMHISHVFEGGNYEPGHGHPLVVGKFVIPVPEPFMGQIGEVRIWNTARTRQEIRRYKDVALTGKEPGLAACWTFEQNEGQFAYDISGNNNHGRLGKAIEPDDADPKWIDLEAALRKPGRIADVPVEGEREKDTSAQDEHISLGPGDRQSLGKVALQIGPLPKGAQRAKYSADLEPGGHIVTQTGKFGGIGYDSWRGKLTTGELPLIVLPAQTSIGPPKTRGGISGVVVSSVTGEPIAGAYVGVGDFGDSGGSNYSRHREQGFHDKTKTDEKGRFELDGLAFTDDHPYLKVHPLVVTHPDFVRHDEEIELLSSGPVPDVKVTLRQAAKIDVTIVDADGNPLEGQWLIRLEALDGRRFIPPGSDPHLSSFASSIWANMPDLRTKMGVSNGFTFTELDTGEYLIEAIRLHLVDKPTPQRIWESSITYHGAIEKLRVEAGRTKQVQIKPANHQTAVTLKMPETPEIFSGKQEIPRLLTISRKLGLMLWDTNKAYGLEDPRLGHLQKNAFFYTLARDGDVFTIKNLPPGSYCVYAGPVICMSAVKADIVRGRQTTIQIPKVKFDGTAASVGVWTLDRKVELQAKQYSVKQLCEILTSITKSNPRIIADPSIENEKLSFGKGEMPIWDVLEMLYLDSGWGVEEGQEKTLIIRPADKTDVPDEGGSRVSRLLAALQNEKYVHIHEPIIQMVEEIGDKEPISFLTEQLKLENRRRKCDAALALELLGDRRGVPAIIKELNDTSYRPTTMIRSDSREYQEGQIRQDHYYAALLLGILGDERAVPALIEATADETIDYRAAMSLGEIGDKRAVPALRAMLDKNLKPFQRLFAGYGLAMLNEEEGLKVVIDTLDNQELQWTVRSHAIEALGKLGDKEAIPYLITALKGDHPNIRVSAARALGAIGDASALSALEEALKDNTETKVNAPTTVSKAAAEAIAQIKAGNGRIADVPVDVEGAGEKVSQFIGVDLPASVQNVKFHSGSFAESSKTWIRFDIPLPDLKNLLAKSDKLPDFPDLHKNPKIQKDMVEAHKGIGIKWWKPDELESPVCAAWIKSNRAKGAPKVWVVNILNICCSQVENNLMRVYISLYSHAH